jgi:Kdo2-lipid IVA lauroyltransferase/acyltransferase
MIGYLFFRLFTALFSILPFGAVYKVSDFLAWVLYKVVKYRRKVVEQQLQMCFPEKSSQELQVIAKRSYKNLSDIIVESIKCFSMSKEVLMDRYRFVNPEVATKYTDRGQCVIQVAAHYGNWEWGVISYALWFRSPSMGFYKPLSNKYTDKYAEGKRGRFGFILVSIANTAKAFEQYKNDPATFVFVSDQSTSSDKAHWVTFFGQDTACPPGVDKYSRLLHCPVMFVDIQRVGRGYYEVTLEELTDGKENLPEGVLTERYMQKLETILRAKPEDWLWSHKRWKKKRQV